MKSKTVGIFTDTHGNYLALTAMLNYFKQRGIKKIFHLGDIVSIGPRPVECMERLTSDKDIVCILGNHDNDYLNDNTVPPALSHVSKEHKRFMFDLLGDKYKQAVSEFPKLIIEDYFGVKVAFLHYGFAREIDLKRNKKAVFRPIDPNPTANSFDKMFEAIEADIIFFGHKHSPVDLKGKKVYCDVGSVGCHKGEFARGVVFTVYEDKSYNIERVTVPYDRNETLTDMNECNIPCADHIQKYYFAAD
mgnify:FL=1|jgi:predicted phosphodiesterase